MQTPEHVTSVDGRAPVVSTRSIAEAAGEPTAPPIYCAYCGEAAAAASATAARFGQFFCSETHAERFAEAVRSARVAEVAKRESAGGGCHRTTGASPAVSASLKDRVKRAACWGAPLLLLIAIPLFWSGNAFAAAGGSLLSLLAMLACPIGMFFMMRAMMSSHGAGNAEGTHRSALPGEQPHDATAASGGIRTAAAVERGKEASDA